MGFPPGWHSCRTLPPGMFFSAPFHHTPPQIPFESRPLEEAIQKADVLIEALQWIRQFRSKITVIKLGGSVMEDARAMAHLLLDVVFMETVGMWPVIVHGGGAAISRGMTQAGLEPRFIQGRRYTDDASLSIVERVLAGDVNRRLAQQINDLGGAAAPLSFETSNVLFGERIQLEQDGGPPIDLGHVGQVTRVDCDKIKQLCGQCIVPVIPSMCVTDDGEKLNVNGDTAATAVARELGAEKLVFLSDVNGVRRQKEDPDSLIHSLSAHEANRMIDDGSIESGMIPKVQACLETLERGVGKVHIIDGRLRHSLLLEVYTSKGVGTEIV
jgi:acetylglutamate kinase